MTPEQLDKGNEIANSMIEISSIHKIIKTVLTKAFDLENIREDNIIISTFQKECSADILKVLTEHLNKAAETSKKMLSEV